MNLNPVQSHRSSGIVLRLGAVVALAANVAIGLLFPDHNSLTAPLQPLYVPLNFASVIGVSLLLFGLPGWYARHSDELGRRGLVGVVLVAVTLLIAGIFMGLYTAIVMPFAATQAPALVSPGPVLLPVLLIGVVAEIVGPLLVGWDMLVHSVGQRWAAWTMLASAPVTVVWFVSVMLDNDGPASPLQIIANILSAALLFVALGGFGAELGGDAAERRQAVAVRSAA